MAKTMNYIPYVIWAPDYRPESGGVKVLHKLCHLLNNMGIPSYIFPGLTNKEWNTPRIQGAINIPYPHIGVYPEIVDGNPLQSTCVARWILNVPGRLAGNGLYNPTDLLFPYMRTLNQWNLPDEYVLYAPIEELDIYKDKNMYREGKLVFFGKAEGTPHIKETIGLPELKKTVTANKKKMANWFNQSELFYCFDNQTAMWDIARLCGCPTVIIPNGEITYEQIQNQESGKEGLGFGIEETQYAIKTMDSKKFRENYINNVVNTFQKKLEFFIDITQKRVKSNINIHGS
jgi:O-antigen biosynthesis protein